MEVQGTGYPPLVGTNCSVFFARSAIEFFSVHNLVIIMLVYGPFRKIPLWGAAWNCLSVVTFY